MRKPKSKIKNIKLKTDYELIKQEARFQELVYGKRSGNKHYIAYYMALLVEIQNREYERTLATLEYNEVA